MKRMMLLLGLCFCISGLYAQKFETEVLDEGNTYEVRVKHLTSCSASNLPRKRLPRFHRIGRHSGKSGGKNVLISC